MTEQGGLPMVNILIVYHRDVGQCAIWLCYWVD